MMLLVAIGGVITVEQKTICANNTFAPYSYRLGYLFCFLFSISLFQRTVDFDIQLFSLQEIERIASNSKRYRDCNNNIRSSRVARKRTSAI